MASRVSAGAASGGWSMQQWRAVRSPHRVHLLAALEALGDASVAELAALTGRSRQSIYPHLAAMARMGIIGTSVSLNTHREVVRFRYLAEMLARSVDPATGTGLRQGADVSARALGDAQLRCRRWGMVADGKPIDFVRNPEAMTHIRITWLDEASRSRLNQLLRQVRSLLQQGCIRRKGQRTCVLLFHFPDFTAREARQALRSRTARRHPR
jgi:hypothetical protein